MKIASSKGSKLEAVIEFNFTTYYVYGVVIEEDESRGDSLLMFAPKYSSPLKELDTLYTAQLRCKFLVPVKHVVTKKNSDLLKFVGRLDIGKLPYVDHRYRVFLPVISDKGKWQIVDGEKRIVVPYLTPETAILSDSVMPNMEYIREYFDADYYPWSAALTSRGSINFDASDLEARMRRKIAK
jgi:hypothetical protein